MLVVYREASARLRTKPASVPPDALQRAAKLMRTFAEDYHEKQLEEAHVSPALTKGGGALVGTVNTLIAQHQRGRDITEYVIAVTQKAIAAQAAEPLAREEFLALVGAAGLIPGPSSTEVAIYVGFSDATDTA